MFVLLGTTPAEREYKEKVNRKKKREEKEIKIRDCIEASFFFLYS
jgi:hypothetical protein